VSSGGAGRGPVLDRRGGTADTAGRRVVRGQQQRLPVCGQPVGPAVADPADPADRDGVLDVDGCPAVCNPSTPAVGIATAGRFWIVGGYHYANVFEQTYHGWLGDVRIVGRALPVGQFLNARGRRRD
jgi:hypothetical protein